MLGGHWSWVISQASQFLLELPRALITFSREPKVAGVGLQDRPGPRPVMLLGKTVRCTAAGGAQLPLKPGGLQ